RTVRAVGRPVWFDPAGERHHLGAPRLEPSGRAMPSGTTRSLPRIDPARIYPLTCRIIFVQRSTMGSTLSAFSAGSIGTTRATPPSARRFFAQAKRGDFD